MSKRMTSIPRTAASPWSIDLVNAALPREALLEIVELPERHRRLEVRELEVEAERRMEVVSSGSSHRAALILQLADALRQLRVVGHEHAALPRRHRLVRRERETPGVAPRTEPPALVLAPERFRGVLHHRTRPCFFAIAQTLFMSAPRPVTCTGTTAFVRDVIARSKAAGSMFSVLGSTSTSTVFAPARVTAFAVAMNVTSGTMTSSPDRRRPPRVRERSPWYRWSPPRRASPPRAPRSAARSGLVTSPSLT